MPSKYCEKLLRCKNAWWCATDYKPSKNVKCFDAMTNYDRIVSKTPEELAEWIESIEPAACPWRDDHGDNCRFTHCHDCWLDWLQKEAEEGE